MNTMMRVTQRDIGTTLIAVVAILMHWLVCTTALAGDHKNKSPENYESKFYGTVESLPQDFVGIWIVNGRKIVVDKATRFKVKHGRPEPGAYVEVEGSNTETIFIASEIKVKRAKHH
ncbi:MAG: DUF5666 domain-containing protein [Desulfurivibrionaceae bacterium]